MRRAEILAVHAQVLGGVQAGYPNLDGGLFVLTEGYLADRRTCCKRGCRHCPYLRSAFLGSLGDGQRGCDEIADDGGQADGPPTVPVGLGNHGVGQHHEQGAGGEGLRDEPVLGDVG